MEQHASSGKRIRKPSLLYEDFESPSLPHTMPQAPPAPPQPPVKDASRPGRMTNQLQYLQKTLMKCLWRHEFAWPFHEPVDAYRLKLPVRPPPPHPCVSAGHMLLSCSSVHPSHFSFFRIIIRSSSSPWTWGPSRSVWRTVSTAAPVNASKTSTPCSPTATSTTRSVRS